MKHRDAHVFPRYLPTQLTAALAKEKGLFLSPDEKWLMFFGKREASHQSSLNFEGPFFLLTCYLAKDGNQSTGLPTLCFHTCWRMEDGRPTAKKPREGVVLGMVGHSSWLPSLAAKMHHGQHSLHQLDAFQSFTGVPIHDAELRQSIERISSEEAFASGAEIEKSFFAYLLMRNLFQVQEELKANRNRSGESLCQMVIRFMEANLSGQPLSLQQLADFGGVSVSKLKIVFRDQVGGSVYQFYLKLRMNYALELLSEGRMNVSEVAYHIGYSSVSKFSRKFQEHHGILPSKMAQKLADTN